jgi:hypothetical protein
MAPLGDSWINRSINSRISGGLSSIKDLPRIGTSPL